MNRHTESLIFVIATIAGAATGLIGGTAAAGMNVPAAVGWLMFAVALMLVFALYRKFRNRDDSAEMQRLREGLDFYRNICEELLGTSNRLAKLNEDINAINKDVIDTNVGLYDDLSDLHKVVNELLLRAPDVNFYAVNRQLDDTRYYFQLDEEGKPVLYLRARKEKK